MEFIATFIRHTLPEYLRKLPVPSTFAGFAGLSGRDWVALVPLVGTVSFAIYLVAKTLFPEKSDDGLVNRKINKSEAKVATSVDVEDLGNKAVFCRCWKSEKFPYCDGTHAKHNKETGDNVGPLIVNCAKKD